MREGTAMVGDGLKCKKDLRSVGRESRRRGEKLRKERSEHLSLAVSGGREKKKWSDERVLPVGLIFVKLRS